MKTTAFLAFAAFAILGLTQAMAETRTAPSGTQPRPPATNYSTNPNASNPKLGGPTFEQFAKACAQIRSDCAESCKPKPVANTSKKPICDKPCEGWFAPLCQQAKANAGCYTNAVADAAAAKAKAIFASLNADSCVNTCVYQTDKSCADFDAELIKIKGEAKRVKLIP